MVLLGAVGRTLPKPFQGPSELQLWAADDMIESFLGQIIEGDGQRLL